MRLYSFRNLIIAFLVLFGIVLLVILNTFSDFRSQKGTLSKIQNSRRILQTLEPAQLDMQDFQIKLNLLLAFKKDEYMENYIEARNKLQNDSGIIVKLIEADPANSGSYTRIAELIHEMTSYSGTILHSHEAKIFDTINNKWEKNYPQNITSEFKVISDTLQSNARKILTHSYNLSVVLVRKTSVLTGIISLFLVLALFITFLFGYRAIFIHKKNEAHLKKFNEELEKQVQEKTAGYFGLIDTIDGIVWEGDAQTFQFSFVSKQAERLLGYPVEQWIKEPTFRADHIHPDDKTWAVDFYIQNTSAKQSHEFEYRMITNDGRTIWLRDIVTVIVEDDKAVKLRGIMVDITEQKKTENEVQESEKRYRSVIEQASDAIMITDHKGNFIDVNTSFCKRFGYNKEEIIGLNVEKFIDPGQLKNDPVQFDYLLSGGAVIRERRMVHKDGTIIEVEANVKMLPDGRMLAIARDITNRKKQEAKLLEQEVLLRLFIEYSPASLAMFDKNMRCIITSRRWIKDYNLGNESLIGKSYYDIFPTTPERLKDTHLRCLLGAVESNEEDVFMKADGSIDWVRWEIHPWHKVSGEIGGIIMFTEVISERKKAQEELEESYKAIRQLTEHLQIIREDERKAIAREIHDELGQQLTVLKMDISWLKKKILKSDVEVTKRINDLLKMTDASIKSVRKISSELRPSQLDDLGLIATMEWHLKEFEKRSGIKTSFTAIESENELPVTIKTTLFRIFQESLTNVARHAAATSVTVSIQLQNSNYVLNISDNGKGFDKKKIADKRTLGILGMKERTAMTGGTYEIASAPGKGTTIVVSIPFNHGN